MSGNGERAELIDSAFLMEFFRLAEARLEDNRQHLCVLDGEIGDGDHGTSMANGFAAINRRLRSLNDTVESPASLMREAASAFLSEVGATVGPLYASGFLDAARYLDGGSRAQSELGGLIAAIAQGIAVRGKAQVGDKTMLDAWIPAGQAAIEASAAEVSPRRIAVAAATAAARGAEGTLSLVAALGRAARLHERSLGHLDPGAVSASILVSVFPEICAG